MDSVYTCVRMPIKECLPQWLKMIQVRQIGHFSKGQDGTARIQEVTESLMDSKWKRLLNSL